MRSWRVSLLAIITIGVSLFIGGSFLLVRTNLSLLLERWRSESRVMVYLRQEAGADEVAELGRKIAAVPWVGGVAAVSAEEAKARFKESFPSLSDLVEGWSDDPLPRSFEVAIEPTQARGAEFDSWLDGLRANSLVSMVDDDRDWLRQLQTALAVIGSVGIVLATVLLVAAVFTIASVVKLTAHLYREEIAIMRLVGATEFFIRGPFWVEGLLQGLLGGLLAVAALQTLYFWVMPRVSSSLAAVLVAVRFLSPPEILGVIGVGGLAGLVGAIVSLRREDLGAG